MKVALVPLALGTLTTWLLAGEFWHFLGKALPAGHEAESTGALLTKIATAPATLVALAVVALGLAAWWQRERLAGVARALRGIGHAGVEQLRVRGDQPRRRRGPPWSRPRRSATTQTGVLNWNMLAILAGLVVILAILALGGA